MNINSGSNKIKTLVCGSTFGQFYLEALKLSSNHFELVALLANGSERSKECADFYRVPLLNHLNELDQLSEKIDLACVVLRSGVMGGKGTDISLACIEKGMHVIQEHPVHQRDMAQCLKNARRMGTHFVTGNHYVALPAVKRFISCAQALFAKQKGLFIDISLATQVSFPLIHMLLKALPKFRPFKIIEVVRGKGPFQMVIGEIGDLPFTMRAHNEVNPNDPDNYLHLLHSISIGFSGGRLSLTDTHGPVVWQTRLHTPKNGVLGKLLSEADDHLSDRSTVTLGPIVPPSYKEILAKQWPRAIAKELEAMKQLINKKIQATRRAQQELLCAQYWHELTSALGYPVLKPDSVFNPVNVDMLQEQASHVPPEPEEITLKLEKIDA